MQQHKLAIVFPIEGGATSDQTLRQMLWGEETA